MQVQAPTSRSARVDVFVGEGTFPCALVIEELILLEESRGAGPMVLMDRLRNQSWKTQDIREVIRWGLIGGGMEDRKAFDLVNTYVREGRLFEYLPTAFAIMHAAIYGVKDDPLEGEPEAPAEPTTLED